MGIRCLPVVVLLTLPLSCEEKVGAGGLTKRQCTDLVRRVDRIQGSEAGGMREALAASQGSSVDACLERATERVFRCVMQAEEPDDLAACESLYE